MKMTIPSALILSAIANGYRYGFDIIDATGLKSGTVYPALRRLDRSGMLRSTWENRGSAHAEGRPPRRIYELTPDGMDVLPKAVARLRALSGFGTEGAPNADTV